MRPCARIIAIAIVFLLVIGPSTVFATPGCVLYVKPTGGGGTGPYVIASPATLEIGIKASGHGTITTIWLMLILNDDTRTNLVEIRTTVTDDFLQGDFMNPENVQESRIPRTAQGQYDASYPGYKFSEQYTVSALKSHIYGSNTGTIWYFVRKTTISSISRNSPATFILTVDAPGATQMKVMVLALGYSSALDHKGTEELNECTSLGAYTFVVPQIASVFLALAPIAALGLYTYKQKKTNRNVA